MNFSQFEAFAMRKGMSKGIVKTTGGGVLVVLASILTTLTILSALVVVDTTGEGSLLSKPFFIVEDLFKNVSVYSLLIFVAITYFYSKYLLKPLLKTALGLAIFLSIVSVFAVSFRDYLDWRLVFGSRFQLAWSIIQIAGLSTLYYICLAQLFRFLDRYNDGHPSASSLRSGFMAKVDKYFFPFSIILIILAWLPLLIIYFPGSLSYDAVRQLLVSYGFNTLSNHHPILITWIYGFLLKFGTFMGGSESAGLFLMVVFQVVTAAFSMALVCCFIKKLNLPKGIAWLALLYYMVNPIVNNYASTVAKDTVSATAFLLFILILFCLWRDRSEELPARFFIGLFALGLFVSLSRNNCVFAVVAALLSAIVLIKKNRKASLICLVGLVISYSIWNFFVLPGLGVSSGKVSEALSIPFQQTARYVVQHPDEVTEEERSAIDKVIIYDDIAENYDPQISDYIRRHLRETISGNDYIGYFKAWATMSLRHPETYIEATMANSLAYFYPEKTRWRNVHFLNSRPSILDEGDFDFPFSFDENLRNDIVLIADRIIYIPVYGLLCTAGMYTWMLLMTFAYVVHRRQWSALMVLMPLIVVLLTCMASPLNGSLRYMLPIVFSIPILVALCCSLRKDKGIIDLR